MKNIFTVLLALFLFGNLLAQHTKSINEIKKELETDNKELDLLEEQIESFGDALESGQKKDIEQMKLIIEKSMLREIQQGKDKLSTQGNKNKIKNTKSVGSGNRTQKAKEYLESKNRKANQNLKTKRERIIANQQSIYERFVSNVNYEGVHSRGINKLALSFYDTVQEELLETKKLLVKYEK